MSSDKFNPKEKTVLEKLKDSILNDLNKFYRQGIIARPKVVYEKNSILYGYKVLVRIPTINLRKEFPKLLGKVDIVVKDFNCEILRGIVYLTFNVLLYVEEFSNLKVGIVPFFSLPIITVEVNSLSEGEFKVVEENVKKNVVEVIEYGRRLRQVLENVLYRVSIMYDSYKIFDGFKVVVNRTDDIKIMASKYIDVSERGMIAVELEAKHGIHVRVDFVIGGGGDRICEGILEDVLTYLNTLIGFTKTG